MQQVPKWQPEAQTQSAATDKSIYLGVMNVGCTGCMRSKQVSIELCHSQHAWNCEGRGDARYSLSHGTDMQSA